MGVKLIQMGRQALPAEVKRKRGTYRVTREKEPLAIVEPADLTIIPPQLMHYGQQMWNFIGEYCGTWISPSDMPTVILLCEAMDRRAALVRVVETEGMLLRGKDRDYINPALKQLTDVEAAITKWMSQLGLNPSDRGRLGLTEVKARSKLEEMRDRANARRQKIS